jgi:FtsZ-binding cell division protein ZapB
LAPASRAPESFGFGIDTDDDSELVRREYRLPDGMREALMEFMLRDDVPLLVCEGQDSIVVDATPAQHEVFAAFVRMIHPEGRTRGAARAIPPASFGVSSAIDTTQQELAKLQMQRDMLNGEAHKLRQSASEAERRADDLRESSEGLEEQLRASSRLNDPTANRALTEALRAIEQRAKAAENEARSIERQADSSDDRIERMAEAIERLEEKLAELAERQYSNDDAPASALTPASNLAPISPVAPAAPVAPVAPVAPLAPAAPPASTGPAR